MKIHIKSVIIYCLGLFILALGVSFSVLSDLGVSPISSIPYVVSLITGIDLGTCTTVVLGSFIFIQILLLGKNFKLKYMLQLIASSIFGFFVSFTTYLTSSIHISDNYIIRLLFCFISVILIAIGVFLYLTPNLLSLPSEGVMQAMCERFHLPIHHSKTIFDCSVVFIASMLSIICLGQLDGIREGTVIAAVCVGICMKYIKRIYKKFLLTNV